MPNKVLLGTNLRCASVCPRARRYTKRWRSQSKVAHCKVCNFSFYHYGQSGIRHLSFICVAWDLSLLHRVGELRKRKKGDSRLFDVLREFLRLLYLLRRTI